MCIIRISFTSTFAYGFSLQETKGFWIYFSKDDKAIYLDSGEGPVKYSGTEVDLSEYYTKEEINNKIENVEPSLEGYATEEYVNDIVESLEIPSVDNLATKDEIEDVKTWVDDKNFLTEHQDLTGYATEDYVAEQIENLEFPEFGDVATNKEIVVSGVIVGNLSNGTVIPEGTTFTELLEMMLKKQLGIIVEKPKVVLTGSSLDGVFEVGDTIDLVLRNTYTDGKFVGESGYDYSIDAGCTPNKTTYYKNDEELASNTDLLIVDYGTTKYKVVVEYNASTNTPVDNNGKELDESIPAGSASSEKTIKGAYKYFLGYSDKTKPEEFTSTDIRNLFKSDFIVGRTTVIGDTAIKSNGKSIVIAFPKQNTLESITNSLGASILSNFEIGETSIATGTINTPYSVYVYPITNNTEVEFKNVIIG